MRVMSNIDHTTRRRLRSVLAHLGGARLRSGSGGPRAPQPVPAGRRDRGPIFLPDGSEFSRATAPWTTRPELRLGPSWHTDLCTECTARATSEFSACSVQRHLRDGGLLPLPGQRHWAPDPRGSAFPRPMMCCTTPVIVLMVGQRGRRCCDRTGRQRLRRSDRDRRGALARLPGRPEPGGRGPDCVPRSQNPGSNQHHIGAGHYAGGVRSLATPLCCICYRPSRTVV